MAKLLINANGKALMSESGKVYKAPSSLEIPPVTNLSLSSQGLLSWNVPDVSKLESKGYTITLSYDLYINGIKKTTITTTSINVGGDLVEGKNTIKVIAKAEIKYFNSDNTEIVESWSVPLEVTAYLLLAKLPKGLESMSAVAINNKAYIFGGYIQSSVITTTKNIVEFDPTSSTCTTLSVTLPYFNASTSAVVINNKAYIFGGYNDRKYIFEFDPNENTCINLSVTLPYGVSGTSAVAINNKAYIFGGYASGRKNTIVEFDPTSSTCTTLSVTLPEKINNTNAVAINNKAYIFGGIISNTTKNIVEFDPTSSTCTTLSVTLTSDTYGVAVVVINNKAYIFGGEYCGTYIQEFNPSDNTLTLLSTRLPQSVKLASAVVINNKAYIFGGDYRNTTKLDTIMRVDNLG